MISRFIYSLAIIAAIGLASCGGGPSTTSQTPATPVAPTQPGAGSSTGDTVADALERGDRSKAEELLRKNSDPNAKSATGEYAVFLAISRDEYFLWDLLRAGANLNIFNLQGETPLTFAVKENKSFSISLFLEKRAGVNDANKSGELPLFLTLDRSQLFHFEDLIRAGADINLKRNGDTILIQALRGSKRLFVSRLLKNNKPDLNLASDDGDLPLSIAIDLQDILAIADLLEGGADPNLRPKKGDLPLVVAIERGDWILLEKLLRYNANPNDACKTGESLLHFAVRKGQKQVIASLVRGGADPFDVSRGESPLFAAARSKFCGLVTALNVGARVDATDILGDSALMVAAREGSACAITELLNVGANPNFINASGESVLHAAVRGAGNRNANVLRDLLEKGADANQQDSNGNTPLHILAQYFDKNLYDLLVLSGARDNIPNRNRQTPRDIMFSPNNLLNMIETKLAASPLMGLREELITQAQIQEFDNLDTEKLNADGGQRYTIARSELKRQLARVRETTDRIGRDNNACADVEAWYKLVLDKSIKIWVWDFTSESVRKAVTQCQMSDLVDRTRSEHRANRGKVLGKPFDNIVIQGAGPSGLLSALLLYPQGSQVQVFEKRNKEYERRQIVRLDPRWHATLQYLLGNGFDEMVATKKVRVNEDQTLELPARELEIALKLRLDQQNERDILGSRFEYGEVSDVNKDGQVLCEGCPRKSYAASQLILAGGANNPVRDGLLGAPNERTPHRPYAVAAFDKIGGAENRDCLLARHFREALSPTRVSLVLFGLCDEPRFKDSQHCKNIWGYENGVDARQFETSNVLYFGVELPEITRQLFFECQGSQREAAQCTRELANSFASQAVSFLSKKECSSGLKLASAQMFDLSQSALRQTAVVIKPLAITAVGDALVTPHFFSGSGLSSSRIAIEDLAELATRVTFGNYVQEVSDKAASTIDFTLYRGSPYFK